MHARSFRAGLGVTTTCAAWLSLAATPVHADPAQVLAGFRPSWSESYQLGSGHAHFADPNTSYLQADRGIHSGTMIGEQVGSLMDPHRAAEWRQQYDDLNRDYEQRQRAGLTNPTVDQAHQGAISDYSNKVLDEVEKRKLQNVGDDAARKLGKNQTAQIVLAPGAVAAGFWIGRPVRLRLNDDSNFSLRTSLRDRFGQLELHSSLLTGSVEFHPQAGDAYTLVSPTSVDFGKAMDFNNIVDFGAERYQFKLGRTLPFVGLDSSVIYGSSSNVVASSLTRQITPHLAAVVDSLYYLTPYEPDHSLEERVRLRYDIHF